jgi:hypothetical protein
MRLTPKRLLAALEKEIRRRTAHMHVAVGSRRAAIEPEVRCLQAVYDKVDAVPRGQEQMRILRGEFETLCR